MRRPSISVVMPMFNEEENIARALAATTEALEAHASEHEIIVVDDASTDGSPGIVRALAERDQRIRVVRNERNRKLGGSLRAGIRAARMELVLYMDADLPFDPFEIGRAVRALELTGADMIAAYRHDRTGEGLVRAVYSYAYNALIGMLFGWPHRDVNFSFKLMRRSVLERIVLRSEGSLISAELLVKARNLGFRVQQIGVDYFPRTRGRSTLASAGVILTILRELLALQGEMRHPMRAPRPRATAAWVALGLFLATLASRIPFATDRLWAHDSVLYARALENGFHVGFDLAEQRPHAPGYLLYVGVAQLARAILGDANAALVLISIVASAASAALLYLFAARFARHRIALTVALAYAAAPLVWTYSEVAYPYTLLGVLSLALAWLLRSGGPAVATGLAFGIAAGFRQDLIALMAPLWLWSLRDLSWRARAAAMAAVGVGSLAWSIPTVVLSGGIGAYIDVVLRQATTEAGTTSVAAAGLEAFASNLRLAGSSLGWGLFALVPAALVATAVWGARAARRRDLGLGGEGTFFALWILPALAVLVLVHIGEPGHVLSVLPAIYVALAASLERLARSVPALPRAPALARAGATAVVVLPALAFTTGTERFSAASLDQHDRALAARIAYVRATFPASSTAILAREDFLLIRHYLPEYRAWYHDPLPFTKDALRKKRCSRLTAIVVFTDGLRPRPGADVRVVDLGGGVRLSYVPTEPGNVVELQGERYAVRLPAPEERLLSVGRRR